MSITFLCGQCYEHTDERHWFNGKELCRTCTYKEHKKLGQHLPRTVGRLSFT